MLVGSTAPPPPTLHTPTTYHPDLYKLLKQTMLQFGCILVTVNVSSACPLLFLLGGQVQVIHSARARAHPVQQINGLVDDPSDQRQKFRGIGIFDDVDVVQREKIQGVLFINYCVTY